MLMDAQTFYHDGIVAIKEHKDLEAGRRLLMQALRLEPENDMAWLWLSRALTDRERQIQAVQRALAINPDNSTAHDILERLQKQSNGQAPKTNSAAAQSVSTSAALITPTSFKAKKPERALLPSQRQQEKIAVLLKKANIQLSDGDEEGAIEHYVRILEIQSDHEVALKEAVKNLVKLGYAEDARELITRAIERGTVIPSIYLTAIDLAWRDKDYDAVESLRQRIVRLPTADETLILKVVNDYVNTGQNDKAALLMRGVLEDHPDSQKLLLLMGDLQQKLFFPRESMMYYNRAAAIGLKTKEGKEADKRLGQFAPVLTDKERGSVLLAVREVVPFVLFYLLLGWQDAGLNLLKMNLAHWGGVILSAVGGYLLISATSSPQQPALAKFFGGKVEQSPLNLPVIDKARGAALQEATRLPIIPEMFRYLLGGAGLLLLMLAFWLVFSTALGLLFDPIVPFIPDPFAEF